MRILNIVSSNIVQDPRVLKQIETIKGVTNDYKIVGMNNSQATNKRLENLDCNYRLLGSKVDPKNILSKLIKRIRFAIGVIREIKAYKPDVIHANDFDVLLMVYLSNYKKANIVYDAHEIYAKNAFINKVPLISKFVESIEKHIVKHRVNAFVTVSHAAKEYYQSKGYKKEANVITNAPILNDSREFKEIENFKSIVYQGQIVMDRGYEEFIIASSAFKQNAPSFIIRGFGPHEKVIKELISYNPENIRLDKPVEVKELVDKLAESNVGVVLTKPVSINFEYTVSNKIFECIHAGLPVILSPVKEHIYLNEKYKFGIVLKEVTPLEIEKAVRKLRDNHDLFNHLRKNAIKASKILNWQIESERLVELYKF
ncbi:capsular biosynthesis protein [Staphylococcus aureus]|uniref:glycosyltransferase n=1 Tax=Staphylococcus aureus TaxID=1280 RepID=UPI00208EA4B1|nr:glycosyltransferase [Staphylococcus aureus]MCO4454233.1 capsular biosynthesis protein [Staphylococcus aureus]